MRVKSKNALKMGFVWGNFKNENKIYHIVSSIARSGFPETVKSESDIFSISVARAHKKWLCGLRWRLANLTLPDLSDNIILGQIFLIINS